MQIGISVTPSYFQIERQMGAAWVEGQIDHIGVDTFIERLAALEQCRVVAEYDDAHFEQWSLMGDVREYFNEYIPDGYEGTIRARPNTRTFHYKVKRVGNTITLIDDHID